MQSTGARVAVGVAAVLAIAVLFLLLSGGEEAQTPTTDVAATETTTGAPDGDKAPPKASPQRPERPEVPRIVAAGGEVQGGAADLQFRKGEEVRFEVVSDVDEEVHVHGYDVYADLKANKKQTIAFPAEIDGVFEVELHGSGAQLAELTVRP